MRVCAHSGSADTASFISFPLNILKSRIFHTGRMLIVERRLFEGASMSEESRARARAETRKLVRESIGRGDEYKWNQELYSRAGRRAEGIPWAEMVPNPNLVSWTGKKGISGNGKRALVIGCGLGDDAEELQRRGFSVTAFDIAQTAIDWCKERFPDSQVRYMVADLFYPPSEWRGGFDFVLESYTLQTFPVPLRLRAMKAIAELVASQGKLLVIARGRNANEPEGDFPWPLLNDELKFFQETGLREVSFEDYCDNEDPPIRRFRVEYKRVE